MEVDQGTDRRGKRRMKKKKKECMIESPNSLLGYAVSFFVSPFQTAHVVRAIADDSIQSVW